MSSSQLQPNSVVDETAPPRRRILIIGAGYGGLGLANRLLGASHAPSHQWQVDVVDQLAPPRSGSLCGRICLPQARSLLTGLGITDVDEPMTSRLLVPTSEGKDSPYLDEDRLLHVLRRKVKVHYLHCVTKLSVASDDRCLYATVWKRRPGERLEASVPNAVTTTVQWGPYDYVIAADGARSRWRHLPERSQRLLWMGDARWVPDRPWDFGRRRLRHGAQLALADAVVLGDLLLVGVALNTTTAIGRQWGHFRPKRWEYGGASSTALILVVVALVAILWQVSKA
jgi:hypothetical protein